MNKCGKKKRLIANEIIKSSKQVPGKDEKKVGRFFLVCFFCLYFFYCPFFCKRTLFKKKKKQIPKICPPSICEPKNGKDNSKKRKDSSEGSSNSEKNQAVAALKHSPKRKLSEIGRQDQKGIDEVGNAPGINANRQNEQISLLKQVITLSSLELTSKKKKSYQ